MESGTKKLSFQPIFSRGGSRGAALVIVLGFLVLIMVVVVAFLTSIKTEYSTANNAAAGSTSRELADASVQLVIGQIRQATSLGPNVAWASQPGMIRDYGTETGGAYSASSDPLAYYKLYSSDNMVVDKNSVPNLDFSKEVPLKWYESPPIYTDLNAPVTGPVSASNPAGTVNYPIIDPGAGVKIGANSMVQGFSVDAAPQEVVTAPAVANTVPMPVKWIYVLRDGTLTAPADPNGVATTVADFSATTTAKKPTADNPIVGRIAFWTDDETCKLNLNTACGGTYWDNPMFATAMEQDFSRYKPAANEFYRYPGHPATTSLLPVFWSMTSMSTPFDNLYPAIDPSIGKVNGQDAYDLSGQISATLASTAIWENLLQFVPRNGWGGSKMGSVPTNGADVDPATIKVSPDADHLYSSVDEALFGYTERGAKVPNVNAFAMTGDNLRKLRFFLTTSSRSPETNPFNQPKIGIWPVPEDNDALHRSALDSLIAFCSTLKPDGSATPPSGSNLAYYFTRKSALDPKSDFTARNSKVFDYLDAGFQKNLPGFGGSFKNRYTDEGDRRILTLIYDFIRSTINLEDSHFGVDGSGHYKNTFSPSDATLPGYGQVTPIVITKGKDYKGIGRFPVINQVAIAFVAEASNQMPLSSAQNGRPVVYDKNDTSSPLPVDADGNLLPAGIEKALAGNAVSMMNPRHLWIVGAGNTAVPQLKNAAGFPVLAVDSSKRPADNSTPEKWLFPIFSDFDTTDPATTPAKVGRIYKTTTSGYAYPTFYYNGTTAGIYGILKEGKGTVQTITVAGTPYKFVEADVPDPKPAATGALPPQTHAGLPYLTMQSPVTGAYSLPNPRYQGVDGPVEDSQHVKNSKLLATLKPLETQMRAVILVDPVNIAAGRVPLAPNYQIVITGLEAFTADGKSLKFNSSAVQSCSPRMPTPYYYLGMDTISGGLGTGINPRGSEGASGSNNLAWYSDSVVVSGSTFQFNGGKITLAIHAAPAPTTADVTTTNLGPLVQTYEIEFPASGANAFPTPTLPHMPGQWAGNQGGSSIIADNINPNAPHSLSASPSYPSGYYCPDYNAAYADDNAHHLTYPTRIADLVPSSLLTFDPDNRLATNKNGTGGPNYGVGGTFPVTYKAGDGVSVTGIATYVDGVVNLGGYGNKRSRFYYGTGASNDAARTSYFLPERNGDPQTNDLVKRSCDTIRSMECKYGDPRVLATLPLVTSDFFAPHRSYTDSNIRAAHSFRGAVPNFYPGGFSSAYSLYRGATENFLSDACLTNQDWDYNPLNAVGSLSHYTYNRAKGALNSFGRLAGDNSNKATQIGITSASPCVTSSADFTDSSFKGVWMQGGDFSNGLASEPDGPYINKPNETGGTMATDKSGNGYKNFYPEWWNYAEDDAKALSTPEQFSPNRMIASPVAFGSLPVGNTVSDAWKTLLFCPNPNVSNPGLWNARMSSANVTEPGESPTGTTTAPDHLMLDFFTMPVVEPYAISEPFSTAGKVNMNYQIAPFTYINRSTALYGVFAGTLLTAVEDKWVSSLSPGLANGGDSHYKSNGSVQGFGGPYFAMKAAGDAYGDFLRTSGQWGFRYPIHTEETLEQFKQRFAKNDLFRSPSEICSLFLYPALRPTAAAPANSKDALVKNEGSNAKILDWWYKGPATDRKSLTGDNMRERPYDSIYPRLTTKSNSFTVHFRVQVLKKVGGSDAAQWREGKDQVVSEYRGSSLIERYIDTGDLSLPDFAESVNYNASLDSYYKFRVVSTKKFTSE